MKKVYLIITCLFFSVVLNAQSIYVTSSGGSYGTEKWMSITTGANGTGALVWGQGNGTYGNGASYLTDEVVDISAYCGTTLYVNAYDKYADDWDGTTYEIWTEPGQAGTKLADNGGVTPNDGTDADASSSWDTEASELEVSEAFTAPACPNFNITFVTQTCYSDLTYDISVTVNSINSGTTIDITGAGGTPVYYNSISATGSYPITSLTGDNTIIVVDESNSSSFQTNDYLACDICSLSSSPNDEPCDAPLIDLTQAFYGSTECTYTPSAGSPGGCGSIENDSYMKFIASDDTVEIEYTVQAADANCTDGVQFFLFEENTSCSDLVAIPGTCVNAYSTPNVGTTDSWELFGLTIGDEYYIRTDGSAGDLCDYNFEPITGVAITPPNGECADAIVLACGDLDTASIILATDTDKPTGCSGLTTGKGNWYLITGTGVDITLSTDNTGTNFGTEINVYSGTCGSLTCVASDDDSGTTLSNASVVTFTAANGTDYYIYVDGDGTAQGQFELSVDCTSCPADAGSWN